MEDYFVIKNVDREAFLSSVFKDGASYTPRYYDAMRFDARKIADQFAAYCKGLNPETEFEVCNVKVNVEFKRDAG